MTQELDHVAVKALLGGKLDRVVAAFPLREIAIEDKYRFAVELILATDESFLRLITIVRETITGVDAGPTRHQRDAVMGFLSAVNDLVSHFVDRLQREFVILNLGFLQPDKLG
jgi:hypothetical protein